MQEILFQVKKKKRKKNQRHARRLYIMNQINLSIDKRFGTKKKTTSYNKTKLIFCCG